MKKMLVVCLAMAMLFGFSVMAGASYPGAQSVPVKVSVAAHAEFNWDIPEEGINLFVDKAASATASVTVPWSFKSNTPVYVSVGNTGFNNDALNALVNYSLPGIGGRNAAPRNDGMNVNATGFNLPNQNWVISFNDGNYSNVWTQIAAGDYTDTITVTVAAAQ